MKNTTTISLLGLIFVSLGLTANVQAQSCPSAETGADVSVWDSTTPAPVDDVVYPIGGSGQVNGEFSVCNGAGIQVGIRIDARQAGPITPVGNVYDAPIGSAGGGQALWNYSGHIDFGLVYDDGGAAPTQLSEVELTAQLDCDPNSAVVDGPLLNSTDLLPSLVLPGTATFIQLSDNLGFALRCGGQYPEFDPSASGHYEFTITVRDLSGGILAQSTAIAEVGDAIPGPTPGGGSPITAIPSVGKGGLVTLALLLALMGMVIVRRQS